MKRFLLDSFPQFVVNSEIQLPLTLEVCEAYLDYASVKRDKDGNEINPRKYNTYSTINACKSAIKYLYKEADKIPSSDLNILLKDFSSGYKRKIALLKEGGQMPIGEGKSPMSPAGFLFLSEKALTAKSDFALSTTAHVSLVMCWNLNARAASVASIRLDNMSWEGDALLVPFGRTKNDQEGTSCSPKHVYANPSCPWICPILSLSLLVFTRGMPTSGSTTLLLGSNSQERFSKWLAKISAAYGDDIASMGPTATEVGTHSFRKGVASSVSGSPGGPQSVSVWLRAGWSLGNVQGRYIFEGSGGDQFVGRAAAGLNMNSSDFGVLPPHFKGSPLSPQDWEKILPGYRSFYPQCFHSVAPFLLASLVYQRKWLSMNLHPKHPIFSSNVWQSGFLETLEEKVRLGVLNDEEANLSASGIPPYTLLLQRLKCLEDTLECLQSFILNDMPDRISQRVSERHPLPAAAPITNDMLRDAMEQMRQNLLSDLSSQQSYQRNQNESNTPTPCPTQTSTVTPLNQGLASAKVRCPTSKTYDLWTMWWSGRSLDNAVPLRKLRRRDFQQNSEKVNFSKASTVMRELLSCTNLNVPDIVKMSQQARDLLFQSCFNQLCGKVFQSCNDRQVVQRRVDEMSYHTIYDLLKKASQ
ncbi:hypothetical protein LEN26_012899 [Aphanomyces euteiches]|nr:hypothetical protein LEN26_012899 [Aphanomyces euteiches]